MRWINRRPVRSVAVLLAALPFALTLLAYVVGSEVRRAENPNDKLLPAPAEVIERAAELATEPDRRSGDVLLWRDTAASLQRLAVGVAIAASLGLGFGLAIGLFPAGRSTLASYVAFLSLIPPLALLPILFIVFGLGEVSKVVLIAVGITPFIIRDLSQRVLEIPTEQLVKAQTLGGSSWQILLRVALPQVAPRLVQAVRLSLGPAWLFLIAAEAIAAQDGLGYRIFLVRRYLAMDVILPYVCWITFLAFAIDWSLRRFSRRAFGWAHTEGESL
ncbi:ABC transporter permease [Minwuia thermotolerans]|uniref:Lipid kinase n=1 Tax=Minwuia thermotolerans TaxID=2056226 RepID=A0A2M9G3J3_9PROT|nr:ABC transporter permease [Minwuia thermotolerans]PJK30264.1 lipid kinase [Minwuia thermotolerans]